MGYGKGEQSEDGNGYDVWRNYNQGTQTHITTNLSATEIEAFYGNRVRSRLREMFNRIAFPKDAPAKRY